MYCAHGATPFKFPPSPTQTYISKIISSKELGWPRLVYLILRAKSKVVLGILWSLVTNNQWECYFTVLITTFMLLHSCSMLARRNEEYARQIEHPVYTHSDELH